MLCHTNWSGLESEKGTLLGHVDGDSSRQDWRCGHISSEGPPDPRQSEQNECLGMLEKGAALSLQRLAEEMNSLCPVLCEFVGLELLVSVVMLQPG